MNDRKQKPKEDIAGEVEGYTQGNAVEFAGDAPAMQANEPPALEEQVPESSKVSPSGN